MQLSIFMGKSSQIRINSASTKITPSIRYVVSEWIYRVAEKLYGCGNTARRVFHSCVLTFDSAVYSTSVDKFPFPLAGTNLQLTALACIIYSTRHLFELKQLQRIPAPDKILAVCNSNFTLSQLFALCKALDQIHPLKQNNTIFDYFDNLPSSLELVDQSLKPFLNYPLSESVRKYFFVLVDAFLLDFPSIKYSSLTVFQSCLSLAQEIASKKRFMKGLLPTLPSSLSECYVDIFASGKKLFSKLNQQNQSIFVLPSNSSSNNLLNGPDSSSLNCTSQNQQLQQIDFKQTKQIVLTSPKSGQKRKRFEEEDEEQEKSKKRKLLTLISLQT